MCRPSLIIGLVIAAQVSFLAAIGFVLGVIVTSSNLFTTGGSPVLLGIALGFVIASAGFIGAALSNLGPCSIGTCGRFADQTRALGIALISTLAGFGAAVAVTIVPASVPIAGSIIAAVLAATMAGSAGLFLALLQPLGMLETCQTSTTSAAFRVAVVLAIVTLIVAFVAGGLAVGSNPCTGPNC